MHQSISLKWPTWRKSTANLKRLASARYGAGANFTSTQLIDAIWREVERLSSCELTCELEPKLSRRLRGIRAAHGRVLAAKRRKRRRLQSERTWSLAVEIINPAKTVRALITRGVVERNGGTLVLTDDGRGLAGRARAADQEEAK